MESVGSWLRVPLEWAEANRRLLAWSAGLSLLMFVGSLVIMPILLARLRADYFTRPPRQNASWFGRHPAARVATQIVRNALGAVLFLASLAMMVLPGQGIITMLVALSLLDFPGKRRLEIALVRQRHVGRAINWIRTRAGRPPLDLPEPDTPVLE